jgi:O-antigen/teichoic acid export membrane protein
MTKLETDPPVESIGPQTDVLDTPAAGGLVIRGATFRVMGYVAGTALATISIALLTRYLGLTRFGQYTTVISVVTVSSALTDLGMSGLATREYAVLSGAARDHFMRNLLGLRIAISLLAVILATGFAVAAGYETELVLGTALASLGIALGSLQTTVAAPLTATLRLGQTSALELLRQAVLVGLTALLIALGAGVLPLLAALVPAALVVLATTAFLAHKHMPVRPALRPAGWVALIRTTVAFSLATGVGTMYVFTTQILTSLATTGDQNGLFAAAFRVFIVVASIAGLVVVAAFPVLARAARDDQERLAYAVQRLFEVVLILGVAAAIGVITGAKPIIAIVAGPHYAAAAGVLRIDGGALVASFLLATYGLALISLHRHKALIFANLLALSITAVATLSLASTNGARGGAIATVCGEWVLCLAYAFALSREPNGLRPHLAIVAKVAVAMVPAFAVMLLGLPDVLQLLVAMFIYACGVLGFKAVPRELYALLPNLTRDRA